MSQARFVAVCVDPPGKDQANADKHNEYILLEFKGNTKGLEVQHLVYPQHGAPSFASFHTLTDDLPPRVSQLLIRGGVGTTQVEGARQTAYTGDRRWKFNNEQGEHLRVVDKHGKVLAELTVAGDRCDVLPPAPQLPGVIPPIVRPSIPAAAAFGEIY